MANTDKETLYMGIDGGGTKCRVCLQNSAGETLGSGLGGSANPSYGMDVVCDSIITATKEALSMAGLGDDDMKRIVVGAGLGGLHLPSYQKLVDDWQHPFKAMFSTNDLISAALGAHDGKDGGLIIVGTGFSASAVVEGVEHNIGGFGFSLGESCSGYWLGHQAVQAVFKDYDNLGPKTQLSALLANKLGGFGYELADAVSTFSVRDFASIAPLVFDAADAGDTIAKDLIQQSVDFVANVSDQLILKGTNKLVFVGGVSTRITSLLPAHIQTCIVEAIHSPEVGAIFYAKQKYVSDYIA